MDEIHKDSFNISHYRLILRTNIYVLVAYIITAAETLIAKLLGLTSMSYRDLLIITMIVLTGSSLSICIIYYKKYLKKSVELSMFYTQVFMYLVLYAAWVYRLNEIRIFGLFCALMALIIMLSYTSFFQSLLISLGTIITHLLVTWYAIEEGGQSGRMGHQMFYSISMVPPFLLISLIANHLNRQNRIFEKTSERLESMNESLVSTNMKLKSIQKMSDIEMDIASDIQASLFPEKAPVTDHWEVAFSYIPRYGVSGDFYDFYYDEDSLTGMTLFDVSGHGVASALVTFLARPVVYRYFNRLKNERLGRVIDNVNYQMLHELHDTNMFMTGIILRFDGEYVEYVNAGHPELLRRKAGGAVQVIGDGYVNHKCRPIGIMDDFDPCKTIKFRVQKGDVLLLYTDCIIDSNNPEQHRFGRNRLIESFRDAPAGSASEILEYIVNRFNDFLDGKTIEDDLTIIVARRL